MNPIPASHESSKQARPLRHWMLLGAALFMIAGLKPPAIAQDEELYDPIALILYWRQDPTTTMLIDWQTLDEERDTVVQYRVSAGEGPWHSETGTTHPFPFSERIIHRVELTGLEPGTTYDFRFGPDSPIYKFRTMPTDASKPVRFITGGDTRHSQARMEKTNAAAAKYDPEFIVWGGDLAYADGREDRVDRWYEWFDAIKNTLITPEGRVIPILNAIGNHEVRQFFYFNHDDYEPTDEFRASIAPYFFGLFVMPGQPGYNVLDFGDYMSIILLDTDHANAVGGDQTEWLEEVLKERQHVPHVFPVYHVTAYPSHRSYDHQVNIRIREHWVPLFEEYNVRVAFENHDHTYKRTHPIRDGRVDPSGVVYIGDGAWGVGTRDVHDTAETWYLKRAESIRHFILVTVHGAHQHFLMIDEDGNKIDEYPETVPVIR